MTPEERLDRIERMIEKQVSETEKQNEGIRGLIVVGCTCIDSIQELRAMQQNAIDEMRELHRATVEEMRQLSKATDEKLNILIDTVDRIIRHRNGKE